MRIDRVADRGLGIENPPGFDLRNRNKRSVAIDLRHGEGRAERVADTDACVSQVLSIAEAILRPHNVARETLTVLVGTEHPAPAPRLPRTPGSVRSEPPRRGQHTSEALGDWGFAADKIERGLCDDAFKTADA